MEKLTLRAVDALLSLGKATSVFAFIALVGSIFGALWTLCESSGTGGSPGILLLLAVISLLLGLSPLLLRFFRWNLIVWALRRNLEEVLRVDPAVLVGLGRGGGIIAAMLCKLIAERTGKEPLYAVIDRTYLRDGRTLQARVGEVEACQIRGIHMTLSAPVLDEFCRFWPSAHCPKTPNSSRRTSLQDLGAIGRQREEMSMSDLKVFRFQMNPGAVLDRV